MDTKILYHDDQIQIHFYSKAECHILTLEKQILLLSRGVLEELARTPLANLKSKISAIDPSFDYTMGKYALPYERVAIAITQARVNELEDELRNSGKYAP